ncbi:dicarboxylate/amino acid:cation symporter [Candidatus Marinamargulisbacteria bacterium SCGC AG-410-N11]|nr:dicarboxylate/amino acid:cation symporter [Candidatus Marinamargulisbacteria bacterium SCGC AG-410-N11]
MNFKFKLHTQILVSIVLGFIIGIILREKAAFFEPIITILSIFGKIFIRLLKMIIIPIVFSSLVVGIINLGNVRNLGKLGVRTFIYYMSTTIMAVLIGMACVNLIQPGENANLTDNNLSSIQSELVSSSSEKVMSIKENASKQNQIENLVNYVPDNIFNSIVDENMIGIIIFSLIFGCALLTIGRNKDLMTGFVEGINDIMLKITDWIMKIAPIGVFCLIAALITQTGIGAFKNLIFYIITVLIGLVIHVLITYTSILVFLANYSPIIFIKKMFPALATAFSTDSSVATLPVTMDCLENNVGVSKKVTNFVAPLGATMNMDGTALYEAVAAMFIAQAYGADLTMVEQLIIFFTATLASIGAAGIPSAGLVTLVIVLRSVNLPLDAIAYLLAVDRILDMCRTTVNVLGDACGAILLSKFEGEKLQID